MKKKTIILRLDPVTKLLLLIATAGIWMVVLQPMGPSSSLAQMTSSDFSGLGSRLGWIEAKLGYVEGKLGSIDANLGNINRTLQSGLGAIANNLALAPGR